jgi:hypothetical protein
LLLLLHCRINTMRKRVDELNEHLEDVKRMLQGERLLHKARETEWRSLSLKWTDHEKELQDALKQ